MKAGEIFLLKTEEMKEMSAASGGIFRSVQSGHPSGV
jgi:hypothetical protein